jgi:lipooligosaccharide transport system permease protein
MLETLKLSLRVTHRHWLVYRKDLLANMSPTLVDPAMFLLAFGVGLGSHIQAVNGLEYIKYMAPGLAISTALFTAFFEMSYNFYVRYTYEGIYKALLTTPIGVRELLIGEFVWVGLKGAVMSVAVALLLCVFQVASIKFLYLIPIVGAVVAIACGGLGLLANSFIRNINQFQTIYAFFISPMFFFSGAFYPVDSLPETLKWFTYLSPLYHGVKMGQAALWDQMAGVDFATHLAILVVMIVVLVGWAAHRIYPKLRN